MSLPPAAGGAEARARALRASRWALLLGNFAIGCGVMVTVGSLNDLTRALGISVAEGGRLIALAAATMCLSAPLAAGIVAGFDRRRLLTAALAWYAVGHLLCAFAPGYGVLMVLRALTVLTASVFTPQAAAAMGVLAPPEQRGRAIGFVFLGWSLALVLGMPLHSWIGETFGWRWAFGLVAVLAGGAAAWLWRVVPDGIRPPAVSASAWRELLTHPALMAVVAVTALQSAGQFGVQAYLAPYYRQQLGADATTISLLFFWTGLCGLLGNVLMSRHVDRLGPPRAVLLTLGAIAFSLAIWPLAGSPLAVAAVIVPWALGGFATSSAQQARLSAAAPALAPALLALNSSAIYLGHAAGSASGGLIVAAQGYAGLAPVGLLWILTAAALSVWAERRLRRGAPA